MDINDRRVIFSRYNSRSIFLNVGEKEDVEAVILDEAGFLCAYFSTAVFLPTTIS